MDYIIYSNNRTKPNDFDMDYGCSFCNKFNSKVLELPGTTLLICKTCLSRMCEALDKKLIKEIKNKYQYGNTTPIRCEGC